MQSSVCVPSFSELFYHETGSFQNGKVAKSLLRDLRSLVYIVHFVKRAPLSSTLKVKETVGLTSNETAWVAGMLEISIAQFHTQS
jgi:hypothetical protein